MDICLNIHCSLLEFLDSFENYMVCLLYCVTSPFCISSKVTTDCCGKHLFPPLHMQQTPELPLVKSGYQPSPNLNNGWDLRLSPVSNHLPIPLAPVWGGNQRSGLWLAPSRRPFLMSLRHACMICSGSAPADLHCHP